jgi:hypothetical protein
MLLRSVFICVYLPERFRTVSPAISAALRLWFIFLFRFRNKAARRHLNGLPRDAAATNKKPRGGYHRGV